MKLLKIFALSLCVIISAFPVLSFACQNGRAEVLALLKTPAGMTLTKESLKDGAIRKYIEVTAHSAGAEVASIFDSLSLSNKDGNIFVFFVSDKMTSDELASILKEDPNVISASPNRKLQMF